MYLKSFEIRWSDVDANRHLANSAYVNFMSHTRITYLAEIGFGHDILMEKEMGPVVFYEHMYYFKEIFPGRPVKVSMQVMGMSEDGKFFKFHHNFYDYKGRNFAHCEMMGAWMNLKTRKLTGLTDDLLAKFNDVEKPEGYSVLSKADTRKFAKAPKDLV
ncbi:acyl-CoA thioesterase [Zobellia uliginosa]|mgnify:CR=1 FL=1|uniref:acyl-CoA thioesterase n=1 Tax=Zobellia uliginosa TaxID=143224 RepID=UPI001C066426|nr:acyl-CoA thioesterase [Zobellia uliginosa]MBU2948501.1 thioesterase family protein [Zobellia uliginosa]